MTETTKKAIRTFIDSVMGNMPKCAEDLRDAFPRITSMEKLEHFNKQWKANQVKSKHTSIIDNKLCLAKERKNR